MWEAFAFSCEMTTADPSAVRETIHVYHADLHPKEAFDVALRAKKGAAPAEAMREPNDAIDGACLLLQRAVPAGAVLSTADFQARPCLAEAPPAIIHYEPSGIVRAARDLPIGAAASIKIRALLASIRAGDRVAVSYHVGAARVERIGEAAAPARVGAPILVQFDDGEMVAIPAGETAP